jgi:hypothetical protein
VTYLAIEPDLARALADRLAAVAGDTEALGTDVARALLASDLDSAVPTTLRRLADSLTGAGAALRRRADGVEGFQVDLALGNALLAVTRALAIEPPACALGPSTTVGMASPCDPVVKVKVYSLGAGAFIPLAGVAGLKLDGAYLLRVEYLQSGLLRVTRIDEAALGVAWSVGQDSSLSAGPLTTMSGASAKAWVQLLLARGTTYEIAPAEFDDFLVADALDHLERLIPLPVPVPGLGLLGGLAKRVLSVADALPLWKAHDFISSLRRRLDWKQPEPLSTFIEIGATAGTNASIGLPLLGKIPVRGNAGLAISGRAVVGVERRPGRPAAGLRGALPEESTYYLDLRAEIGTPLAARVFGIDLSRLRAVETRIGLVRGASDDFERLEITIVTDDGRSIDRRTAVIDITDPATRPDAQRVVDGLTDPTKLPDVLDAVDDLRGHQTTAEHSEMRRVKRSAHGVEAMGNGVRFTVDELDLR